jgi:hypothetical protein
MSFYIAVILLGCSLAVNYLQYAYAKSILKEQESLEKILISMSSNRKQKNNGRMKGL